jgi:toxin-antitoxin system PIN domain toxin
VLLALAWPNHQFHHAATERLERSAEDWATCALTQLAFIRLSSNRRAVGTAKSPAEAASLLAEMTLDSRHRYLEALPAPASPDVRPRWENVLGPNQVTDAYLLRLAREAGAVLLTFDVRLRSLAHPEKIVETLGT